MLSCAPSPQHDQVVDPRTLADMASGMPIGSNFAVQLHQTAQNVRFDVPRARFLGLFHPSRFPQKVANCGLSQYLPRFCQDLFWQTFTGLLQALLGDFPLPRFLGKNFFKKRISVSVPNIYFSSRARVRRIRDSWQDSDTGNEIIKKFSQKILAKEICPFLPANAP